MKKIILTLCLIMIALLGASAVAASADAYNANYAESIDGCHFDDMITNDESSIQTESINISSDDKGKCKYIYPKKGFSL